MIKVAEEEIKAEEEKVEPKVKTETKVKPKDESKEFVDGIMAELNLKGGSKKRLVRMLGKQYGFDRQKVMFKLKRALITERYAAVAEGH